MYILNIPIYRYNTGRADNGNDILKLSYKEKTDAISDREFLNTVFNREPNTELSEIESEKINELIDWVGYQIKDSYVTVQFETLI